MSWRPAVVTVVGTTPPPAPAGAFADEFMTYGMRGRADFNPSSPRLKNGMSFTAAMRTYYDAFMKALLSDATDKYALITSTSALDSGSSYNAGRGGQITLYPALALYSLTGDRRILDRIAQASELAWARMRITWLSPYNTDGPACSPPGNPPWSPYRKLLYSGSNGSSGENTDINNLQDIKYRTCLTRIAWVLDQNRGIASPAGYNYGALADKWIPEVVNWLKAWSLDTGACWTGSYRGVDGASGSGIPNVGSSRTRQAPGLYPAFMRGEGHACFNSMEMHVYLTYFGRKGYAIPNHEDALTAAYAMATAIVEKGWVPCRDNNGRPTLLLGQSGAFSAAGPTRTQRSTYTGYSSWSLVNMWMYGNFRHIFTRERMLRLARQWALMCNPDGTTTNNITGGVARCTYPSNFEDGFLTDGSARGVAQHARNGFSTMMVFADEGESGGMKLFNVGTTVQSSSHGGGYTNPKTPTVPAAQFITRALRLIGDL